jgi:hypothetical protein
VVAIRIGAGWLVDTRRSTGHVEMMILAGAGAVGALVLANAAVPALYLIALPVALLGAWGWPGVFFFTVVKTFPAIPARASGLVLEPNRHPVRPAVVGLFAARGDYRTAWLFGGRRRHGATAGFAYVHRIALRQAGITR